MTGKFIGKYEILKSIGKGGTAKVYKVRDPEGKIFALKYLFPFPELTERWKKRFAREFKILSKLNHPFLIRVYELGEISDTVYYIMDYVEGLDLWKYYRQELRKSPPKERIKKLLPLMAQVVSALEYIHRHKIIHKDLKPANVLIEKNGEKAFLADFGLAREIRESSALYTYKGFLGTLGYSAPELILRKPFDGRSDLYSWGVIFYTLLADRRPIPVEKMSIEEAIEAVLTKKPPSLGKIVPEIPKELCAIVDRCLEIEPENRFASARELWKELLPLF